MLYAALCPALHRNTQLSSEASSMCLPHSGAQRSAVVTTLNTENDTMVVTAEIIILKWISPFRHNILPALTLSNI